jgi:Mce-associated membrane protein
VAGRQHADPPSRSAAASGQEASDSAAAPGSASGKPSGKAGSRAGGGRAERAPRADRTEGADETGRDGANRGPGQARSRIAKLVALVAVVLIALGLAAWFRGEANQLAGSGSASNQALVDVGTTAQVAGQVRDAVERVYSYDYARLDDNERASRQVITGQFAQDFTTQFARVRELAPQQKAVVVAKVQNLAVKVLDGDRAIVVVFLDQQADRGVETKQLLVAGRLTVTAQRVDGVWKIAGVQPF